MTGNIRGSELWWSPDGKSIAAITAAADGNEQITLWDVESSAVKATLGKHAKGDGILALAFSPDGATIAAGHDGGTIRFWNLATGKEKEPIRGLAGPVSLLAWSPDGKTLAVHAGGATALWGVQTRTVWGKPVSSGESTVTALEFSPDGKWLARLSKKRQPRFVTDRVAVTVWQVAGELNVIRASAELTARYTSAGLETLDAEYRALVWSDDSKSVTAAIPLYDIHAVVLDVTTGNTRDVHLKLSGSAQDPAMARLMRYSPDGKVIARPYDMRHPFDGFEGYWGVGLFDAATGKNGVPVQVSGGRVEGLRFSPDGKTLACLVRGRRKPPPNFQLEKSSVNEIRLIDVETGNPRHATFALDPMPLTPYTPWPDRSHPSSLTWTPGGKLAVWTNPKELVTADPVTGERTVTTPDFRPAPVPRVHPVMHIGYREEAMAHWGYAFSPDGEFAAGAIAPDGVGDDPKTVPPTEVLVWNVRANREHARWKGHTKGIHSVVWGRDGQMLVTADADEVLLWNARTGDVRRRLPAGARSSQAWTVSPDLKLVAVAGLEPIPPRREVNGQIFTQPRPPGKPITLWDTTTGEKRVLPITAVVLTWSPDGKFIAYTDDKDDVRVWDVVAGCEYAKVGAMTGELGRGGLAFSPDGTTLAFVSFTERAFGTSPDLWADSFDLIQLWDVAAKRLRAPLTGHYNVVSLAWSHDGKTLASSNEFEVMLWDVSPAK